jgi:hypothetical protein
MSGVGKLPLAPLIFAIIASGSVPVQGQEPYRFYGGDVSGQETNPAIEACEYEELIEKQRCNEALNKTTCIERVREECREAFAADDAEADTAERTGERR